MAKQDTGRTAEEIAADIEATRRKRREKLAQQLGTFDNVMSPEELLRLRETS